MTNGIMDQQAQLLQDLAQLDPLAKGSLVLIHKPCIRPACKECLAGRKHPAWIFAYQQDGKRRTLYVPEALVPALQQALERGRLVEAFLHAGGPKIVRQFRQHRDQAPTPSRG